jgi:hypothetical protein
MTNAKAAAEGAARAIKKSIEAGEGSADRG